MKNIFLTTLFLSSIITGAALGQDQPKEAPKEEQPYVKDLLEINFFGGAAIPTGDIKNFGDTAGARATYNVGFDAGFFITEKFVGGLDFTYSPFKVDKRANSGGLRHGLYSTSLYGKYYFQGASDWVPYVKAQAGVDFAKFTTFVSNSSGDRYRELSYDPAFAFGLGAGVFFFTSDFSGLFAEVNYHRAISKNAKANYQGTDYELNGDIGVIDIHGGIRILIGPKQ